MARMSMGQLFRRAFDGDVDAFKGVVIGNADVTTVPNTNLGPQQTAAQHTELETNNLRIARVG